MQRQTLHMMPPRLSSPMKIRDELRCLAALKERCRAAARCRIAVFITNIIPKIRFFI
jgi:hypothetical protein